jgi:hypothetical protein
MAGVFILKAGFISVIPYVLASRQMVFASIKVWRAVCGGKPSNFICSVLASTSFISSFPIRG